jgi:phosphoribosylamine--glycine ligase
VLEFNARFGDPETQAIVPLCGDTLLDLLVAAAHGDLSITEPVGSRGSAVVVVAAAQGYPGPPRVGDVISGLDRLDDGVTCFHGGTARDGRGRLVTSGGRVLGIVGLGADAATARDRAYDNLGRVRFDGMWFRSDIGMTPAGTAP